MRFCMVSTLLDPFPFQLFLCPLNHSRLPTSPLLLASLLCSAFLERQSWEGGPIHRALGKGPRKALCRLLPASQGAGKASAPDPASDLSPPSAPPWGGVLFS